MLTDKIKDWIEQNTETHNRRFVISPVKLLAQLETWKAEERETVESAWRDGYKHRDCEFIFPDKKTAQDYYEQLKTGE